MPACAAYSLLGDGFTPSNTALRVAFAISLAHVLLALWDQGAVHIVSGHHLAARDMMFFVSDVAGMAMVLPYVELRSGGGLRKTAGGVVALGALYLALKSWLRAP